jgi:hypothetical protein
MEELGDTVEKLHSMYDLERFITEQERLLKRVPELEAEVRRLKPREDQVAVCLSPSRLLSPCLFSPSSLSLSVASSPLSRHSLIRSFLKAQAS